MSKPALWTRTRKGKAQLARAAKAKAAKREKKAVARRAAPRKRIAARSERGRERNAEYLKVRDEFLKAHPFCQVCPETHASEQVHHRRGRVGMLLTYTPEFVATCFEGHQWIDANREKARELGLLAKVGDWNKQPKD